MSGSETNGRADEIHGEVVVVHVEDEINQALTGHGGCSYTSPPQPLDEALTLARVLLGYISKQLDEDRSWTCPIAGGRRTVAIHRVR